MSLGATGAIISSGDVFRPRSNIAAINAQNQLRVISREIGVRRYRIASGMQQPRMEDGPSFFSIQNKMRNQVRGRQAVIENIADASSLLTVLESGLREIDIVLGRMRDLVVRAANGVISSDLREDIQLELSQLVMVIDVIANSTSYNEQQLLTGEYKVTFQVGPNEGEEDMLMFGTWSFTPDELGIEVEDEDTTGISVLDVESAKISIGLIDTAIDHVKDHLSDIGGFQRKLTALSTIHSQGMIAEESQASRFGDADLAKEQSEIAKLQLLEQLSLASLAAANIVPAQIIGGIVGR